MTPITPSYDAEHAELLSSSASSFEADELAVILELSQEEASE